MSGASAFSGLPPGKEASILEAYARSPLSFEPAGQLSGEYYSRGHGYSLSLTAQEVRLTLRQPHRYPPTRRQIVTSPENDGPTQIESRSLSLTMKLIGADPSSRAKALDPLRGKRNYFLGADPSKWRANVPTFAKLRYSEIYPGVDLVYYGAGRQLEYDFIVAPGADPKQIRLAFEGASGMRVDDNGDLVLTTPLGEVRQRRPVIYQETNGGRREVTGKYILLGEGQIGFEIGEYDASLPLVIDPVIVYSTLLGGSSYESALIMVTDRMGAVYLAGMTVSDDLPALGGPQPARNAPNPPPCFGGCADAYVLKLNAAGTAVEYSTYLGGARNDFGVGLAIGDDGDIYITGYTESPDFPITPGAIQSALLDRRDAFVARISPDEARLVYSTYLGGRGSDRAFNVVVDAAGNAYLTGRTESGDFPTTRPFQAAQKTPNDLDGFIAKLNPLGTELIFSTYLGGSEEDQCNAIAIDAEGYVYVIGSTVSADFPVTPGAYQTEIGGSDDIFVARLKPDGSALVYSTFIGGDGGDVGLSVTLDSDKNAVVTGFSGSFNGAYTFPLVNPLQSGTIFFPGLGVSVDAIVFKLNATGDKLLYSTYLGGGGLFLEDSNGEIAVAAHGRIYLSGSTDSNDFPVTPDAFQLNFGGGLSDAYMAVLDPSRPGYAALIYSSYLGGLWHDYGQSVTLNAQGDFHIAGSSEYGGSVPPNNFPLINPVQPAMGPGDGFVAKVSLRANNTGDNVAPIVTITSPAAAGEYVTGEPRIALTGVAGDNVGVTRVVWRNDRASVDHHNLCGFRRAGNERFQRRRRPGHPSAIVLSERRGRGRSGKHLYRRQPQPSHS